MALADTLEMSARTRVSRADRKSGPKVVKVALMSKVWVSVAMKISPVSKVYWDRMQQIRKGECKNYF
jgi:hypothetical protein